MKLVGAHEFPVSAGWIKRFVYFAKLLERVEGVSGDVVECGVAWGRSLAILALLVRHGGTPRHLYGFDSFQGLSSPTGEDLAQNSQAKKGLFGEATPEAV